MEKVLIVDDDRMNREMLGRILEDDYEVIKAESGKKALMILKQQHKEIALVLLDLVMPEVDGFSVLGVMKKYNWTEITPVVVISGENSTEAERRSLSLGASDYIRKPFDTYMIKRRIKNIIDLFQYKRVLERKVEKQTATMKKQYAVLQAQAERIRESNGKIIEILGTVVEYRNLQNGTHIRRVKEYTRILANEVMKEYPQYELTDEKIELIVSASALHDIGKIAIPDSILLKPGKLTDDEYEYMKSHTTRGAEILQQIEGIWDREYSKVCYEICRYHHERFDGSGYPDGLKEEEIPIAAQIVSIADVYDVMTTERVYKGAASPEQALHMVLSGECGVFNPKLLACLKSVKNEYEALVTENY